METSWVCCRRYIAFILFIQLFYATAAIIYTYILMDFDSQNVQLCVMMLTWLKMESQFLVVNGTLEKIMTTD